MKRYFTFGYYPAMAKGDRMDWDKVVADIKGSNFSGLVIHLMSPWDQDWKAPFFPWKYENLEYQLNKPNTEWYDTTKKVVRLFRKNGLDLHTKLFDRYYETGKSWSKYIKHHPFRNNNIGVKWSNDRQLFNSWLGGNVFEWNIWNDITAARAGAWRPTGKMGDPLFEYVENVRDIVRDVINEFPHRGRNFVSVFNEQISGDTDRHEIVQWVQGLFNDEGIVTGPRFQYTYDLSIRGAATEAEYKKQFLGGYTGNPKAFIKDAKTEVHSVGEQYGYQDYLDWGAADRKMLFSTDGVPAGQNEGAIKELWTSAMPFCDGKSEEGDIPAVANGTINWMKIKDPNKKWNLTFPHHAKYLE